MPPHILDPRDPYCLGEINPKTLPPGLRNFDRVPRPDDLEEGDLILFHKIHPAPSSRLIIKAQQKQFPGEDAIWHHAAVYVGDMQICEAQYGIGVRKVKLQNYLSNKAKTGYLLRVRRSRGALFKERRIIAKEALKDVGFPYDTMTAVRQGIGMLAGFGINPRSKAYGSTRTCALLYYYAYLYALGKTVTNDRYIVPAALSLSDELLDVKVRWVSTRKRRS